VEQNPSGSKDAEQAGRVDAALPAPELHNERTPLVIRWSVKAAVLLANGYVLFFFSERVFWSFPRPNDSLPDWLLTWLAYTLLGWIVLILVRTYRIDSFLPLFLAGAVFGWTAEGVVVDTFYGGPDNPFPLSVSFTGLAWHALLSVGIGWYLLPKALTAPKPTRTILTSLAIGLGWGLWAAWWPNELGQGDNTSLASFAGHALACSLLFLGSWGVLGRVRSDAFQVGQAEAGFLFGLAALLFLSARVPARPLAAWSLPALLLLAAIGLRRSAGHADRRDLLDECLGRIHAANVVALALIPLTAIAVYAPFRLLGFYPATNVVLYLATTPLGFWFFLRALWPRRGRAMREEQRRNIQPEAVR
jgi:hypothetical protein